MVENNQKADGESQIKNSKDQKIVAEIFWTKNQRKKF